MAIAIRLQKTEKILFCSSKWWGDPDMPEQMEYPMMTVKENGEEYGYPLTFICQVNCEDIAPFDPENRLPHEGMLYFFAAIDECLGYAAPYRTPLGEWEKGSVMVKYAKTVNFETFNSVIMVDDGEESITDEALEMVFSACPDDAPCLRLLGTPTPAETASAYPDSISLLQIPDDETAGISFNGEAMLDFIIRSNDLRYGNFKKSRGCLNTIR